MQRKKRIYGEFKQNHISNFLIGVGDSITSTNLPAWNPFKDFFLDSKKIHLSSYFICN